MHKILKGFSEKKDGSMYVPLEGPLPENVVHRTDFLHARGLAHKQVAVANLVHGTTVARVRRDSPYTIPSTDALVTKDADIVLTVTGADCFPLYFEEKTAGIIGLAHGGWRGIVGGIVSKTIAEIVLLGGAPEKIVFTIGPGICRDHFEIGEDVLASFDDFSAFVSHGQGYRVDLRGILREQALASGIPASQIVDTGECTYCLTKKYFSYRRDRPKLLEVQLAYIVQFSHRKF